MAEYMVLKDVLEAIDKIKKLERQCQDPSREGMISVLTEAKTKAPIEIIALELIHGDRHWMPFCDFSNEDLYRKLPQYKQGLVNYCIEKIGQQAYDDLMKK